VIGESVEAKLIFDPPDERGEALTWVDCGDAEPEQRHDEQGRLLPCGDYWFSEWGWSKPRLNDMA